MRGTLALLTPSCSGWMTAAPKLREEEADPHKESGDGQTLCPVAAGEGEYGEKQPAEDHRQHRPHGEEESRVHLHRVAGHLELLAGALQRGLGREAGCEAANAVEEGENDAFVEG